MQHDVSKGNNMDNLKEAATWLTAVWGMFSLSRALAAVGIHTWADFASVASVCASCVIAAYHIWKWRKEYRK